MGHTKRGTDTQTSHRGGYRVAPQLKRQNVDQDNTIHIQYTLLLRIVVFFIIICFWRSATILRGLNTVCMLAVQ